MFKISYIAVNDHFEKMKRVAFLARKCAMVHDCVLLRAGLITKCLQFF